MRYLPILLLLPSCGFVVEPELIDSVRSSNMAVLRTFQKECLINNRRHVSIREIHEDASERPTSYGLRCYENPMEIENE